LAPPEPDGVISDAPAYKRRIVLAENRVHFSLTRT
jgi:hypothetical protein